jgi:hypothetical protein
MVKLNSSPLLVSDTMVLLYHYTSAEGCKGILSDGVIRSSMDTTRDAVLGRGVYLTSLPPSTGDWRLVRNNWDGKRRTLLRKLNKVDYYIVFDTKDLPGVTRATGKRDVWMVPYDIDLDEVPCEVGVRRENVALARQYGYL